MLLLSSFCNILYFRFAVNTLHTGLLRDFTYFRIFVVDDPIANEFQFFRDNEEIAKSLLTLVIGISQRDSSSFSEICSHMAFGFTEKV